MPTQGPQSEIGPVKGQMGQELSSVSLGRSKDEGGMSSRVIGLIASAVLWVLVFGAGVTVETALARFVLAPLDRVASDKDRLALERLAILSGAKVPIFNGSFSPSRQPSSDAATLVGKARPITSGVATSTVVDSGSHAAQSAAKRTDDDAMIAAMLEWVRTVTSLQKLGYFGICLACYSPINIAILSLVAGMMGGGLRTSIVSSLDTTVRDKIDERRAHSLSESPFVACIRGLLAYICILAGLYAFFDDPFKTPTLPQYVKLAGFASGLAFTVG